MEIWDLDDKLDFSFVDCLGLCRDDLGVDITDHGDQEVQEENGIGKNENEPEPPQCDLKRDRFLTKLIHIKVTSWSPEHINEVAQRSNCAIWIFISHAGQVKPQGIDNEREDDH